MDNFYKKLKEFGQVKINQPLARYTTFQIGGPAKFLIIVSDKEKLVGLLNWLRSGGQEYLMVGGGSNLLLPDEELDLVAIRLQTSDFRLQIFMPKQELV